MGENIYDIRVVYNSEFIKLLRLLLVYNNLLSYNEIELEYFLLQKDSDVNYYYSSDEEIIREFVNCIFTEKLMEETVINITELGCLIEKN